MVVDTRFDIAVDEYSDAERVLVHELAHYYWHNSSHLWIDEGAAEIMSVIYREDPQALYAAQLLAKVYVNQSFCDNIEDLQSLEQLTHAQSEDCGNGIGFLLFLDLYSALGPDDFQRGLRELYLLGENAIGPDDPKARGIDQVKSAFSFSPKATGEIIPRWYGAEP